MFLPNFSLINIPTVYEILHFPTILNYNAIWKRRSKPKISFPSFFAFRRGVRGEPEKMEGTFLGLPARVRERGRGACQRNRGVRFGFKPPRTRRVRSQPLRGWKWVRAKVSMSAQIETSRSDRAAPPCGAAGAGGKNARREATNSDGAGAAKRAVLSLFRIP